MNFKGNEIIEMCDNIKELANKPHIIVPVEQVDKYVEFASCFGITLCGGALSNDCKTQVLYRLTNTCSDARQLAP